MTDSGNRTGAFRGGLAVISGPSGSGKTSIVERLNHDSRVEVAITATTRPKRPTEVNGVDYHFLTREEFLKKVDAGDFVEYNEVFRNGHLYGSLKESLEAALTQKDRYYILEIDVEGGANLRKQGYDGAYLFIAPPSQEELLRRIRGRGTETGDAIQQRIVKAEFEMTQAESYDHVVVNDDLERAYEEVRSILGLTVDGVDVGGSTGEAGSNTNAGGKSG